MEAPDIVAAKFKPQHRKLHVELPITSPARGTHGVTPAHQVMLSSKLPQRTAMGVGVIRDGAMHISPLSEVLQMRPSFKNIPTIRDDASDASYSEDEEEQDEKEVKPTLEQVHMKRKETERWQTARLQSFSYLQSRENNEPYQKLRVHKINSRESNQFIESLFESHTHDIGVGESKNDR